MDGGAGDPGLEPCICVDAGVAMAAVAPGRVHAGGIAGASEGAGAGTGDWCCAASAGACIGGGGVARGDVDAVVDPHPDDPGFGVPGSCGSGLPSRGDAADAGACAVSGGCVASGGVDAGGIGGAAGGIGGAGGCAVAALAGGACRWACARYAA